jgi:murein L,D-transpeptidase YafK
MVHGGVGSRGYSMTDDACEIFALARDSFRGGQRSFELEAFPFRMTAENMARHRDSPNMQFWRMLKQGYDHFEVTQVPPKVDVCGKHYVFDADAGGARFSPAAACPAFTVPEPIRVAVAAKQQADEAAYKVAVAQLEDEDAKKVAEEARRQEADAKKIAEMERRSRSARRKPPRKRRQGAGRDSRRHAGKL